MTTHSLSELETGRRWIRGIIGGIVGLLVAGIVSFSLLELVGPSTVYNEAIQSPKLSAVWDDELWQSPKMMSDPVSFVPAFALLGAVQGAVFVIVSPALAPGIIRRGLVYGLILWLLPTLSFEILGPYNLLLEPLPLVGVELAVALPGRLLEGIVISAIYGRANPAADS